MAGETTGRPAALSVPGFAESDPPSFAFEPLRLPIAARIIGSGGLRQKVLTAVAPAGYGKSVLLSVLRADLIRAGRKCLWLALDERATGLDAIIHGLDIQLDADDSGLHPAQALLGGGEPALRHIDRLIERLRRRTLPITLFIDNLHFCTDPQLAHLLDRLCFSTGPALFLVLSSAHDIPFNRTRALLENLLLQIGPTELAFGADQVRAMLGPSLCARLGSGAVERIVERSEGWPAAVRVVQIVLTTSPDPRAALQSLTGSDDELAELLDRYVLSALPPPARRFLLQIGQLRVFCAELCREVSGDAATPAYLDDLLHRNIFVIPLDRQRRWYRLHTLLREFLKREGEHALNAAVRRDVQLRASQWCEAHEQWHDAIDYALSARAYTKAADTLAAIAPWFVRKRGEARQFIEWVETLQRVGHEADPLIGYWYAWALAFHRRYDDARLHIRRLDQQLDAADAAPRTTKDHDLLRRRLAIMLASIDVFTDHLPEAQEGARQWLATSTSDDDPFTVTGARCIETNCYASQFAFVAARQANQQAKAAAFQAQSAYASGWATAYGALVAIYEGQYAQAYAELLPAIDTARRQLGDDGIAGTLALLAAHCATEMALDREARELLSIGLAAARTHGFLEAAACGLEAAISLWSGRDDDTFAPGTLHETADAYPPRLATMLACFVVRRLLEIGRHDEARQEAERIGLALTPRGATGIPAQWRKLPVMRDLLVATEIELRAGTGRQRSAMRMIAVELRSALREGRAARSVELLLQQARLATGASTTAAVLRAMQQAIRLAAPGRIVRPFLRQAGTVSTALADTSPERWALVTPEERSFFEDLRSHFVSATDVSPEAEQIIGTPTPRELDMLRLIDAGLGNQQIADRLGVSLTTTKWHLKNLYAKLGVSGRAAALARAKAARLL
jgi:LuxR family maltose regulon positive regulatory protein